MWATGLFQLSTRFHATPIDMPARSSILFQQLRKPAFFQRHTHMTLPNFELARQYALDRLTRELSPKLAYHSLAHTRDEVVPAADQLAALEGLAGEDLLLLRTAAVFHDTGYIEQHYLHEEGSARMAAAALPQFDYTPAQIAVIVDIILATRLPQVAHTLPEQILADADLAILGQADYLLRNAVLRAELAALVKPATDQQWYGGQLNLIRNHRYFTSAARSLFDAQKQINAAAMAALLAQCQ
jgi:uncharacterized protein